MNTDEHNLSISGDGDAPLTFYAQACTALAEAKRTDEALSVRDAAVRLRLYARQAKNVTLEIDAAEIRIRAERRVGELMAAQRETIGFNRGAEGNPGGRGAAIVRDESLPAQPTLAEAGIDKYLADRARKLERLTTDAFEAKLAAWRESLAARRAVHVDVLSAAHVGQATGDTEWFTPEPIIAIARRVLGGIDLDPASTPEANAVIRAKEIFTADDDGLAREWGGRVWLNPPYAMPLVERFAEKLSVEVRAGRVTAAITITNNATETHWFRTLAEPASAICFPEGRVRFWHPHKAHAMATSSPLQGQALLYFGSKPVTFCTEFATLGHTWRRA